MSQLSQRPISISSALTSPLFYCTLLTDQPSSQFNPSQLPSLLQTVQLAIECLRLDCTLLDNISASDQTKFLAIAIAISVFLQVEIDNSDSIKVSNSIQALLESLNDFLTTRLKTFTITTETLADEGTEYAATTVENELLKLFLAQMRSSGLDAFYASLCFSIVASKCLVVDPSVIERFLERHADTKNLDNLIPLATIILSFPDEIEKSKMVNHQIQQISSEIVGSRQITSNVLHQLIILAYYVQSLQFTWEDIPTPRCVLLVRRLLALFQESDVQLNIHQRLGVKIHCLQLLKSLLSSVSEVYGEHWTAIQNTVVSCLIDKSLSSAYDLPPIFWALKLLESLKKLDSINEDLIDSRRQYESQVQNSAFELFLQCTSDVIKTQPQRVCARQIARSVTQPNVITDKVYRLLLSPEGSIQECAYHFLLVDISRQKETQEIAGALTTEELDSTNSLLPSQLLSLIMQVPDSLVVSKILSSNMATNQFRGYLMSWRLVLQFFIDTSLKLRILYLTCLNEGEYVEELLNFLFTDLNLLHLYPKTIEPPESFVINEDDATDWKHNAGHIYFLMLKYLSSPVRLWWSNVKERGLNMDVEKFTEQRFSPKLLKETILFVQRSLDQEQFQDERLDIRASLATRDILLKFTLDEQVMEMAIRLPSSHPLRQSEIEGVKRVGVKEKQFRSWILASQTMLTTQV